MYRVTFFFLATLIAFTSACIPFDYNDYYGDDYYDDYYSDEYYQEEYYEGVYYDEYADEAAEIYNSRRNMGGPYDGQINMDNYRPRGNGADGMYPNPNPNPNINIDPTRNVNPYGPNTGRRIGGEGGYNPNYNNDNGGFIAPNDHLYNPSRNPNGNNGNWGRTPRY